MACYHLSISNGDPRERDPHQLLRSTPSRTTEKLGRWQNSFKPKTHRIIMYAHWALEAVQEKRMEKKRGTVKEGHIRGIFLLGTSNRSGGLPPRSTEANVPFNDYNNFLVGAQGEGFLFLRVLPPASVIQFPPFSAHSSPCAVLTLFRILLLLLPLPELVGKKCFFLLLLLLFLLLLVLNIPFLPLSLWVYNIKQCTIQRCLERVIKFKHKTGCNCTFVNVSKWDATFLIYFAGSVLINLTFSKLMEILTHVCVLNRCTYLSTDI